MVLSLIVNGVLDIGFGVGWWVVKKVGGSIYYLGTNLFYEKVVRSSIDLKDKDKTEKMEKLIELLEHDLVEIKHNQEIILHKLDVEDYGNVIIDPL